MSATADRETLTRSVEDYLKAIYRLSPEGRPASTSEIAHLLELSAPVRERHGEAPVRARPAGAHPLQGCPADRRRTSRGAPHGAPPPADRGLPGRVPGLRLGYGARGGGAAGARRVRYAGGADGGRAGPSGRGSPWRPIPEADGSIHELACTPLPEVAVGAHGRDPAGRRGRARSGFAIWRRSASCRASSLTLVDRQPFGGPVTVEAAGVRHVIGAELAQVVLCASEDIR